jgi:hypothetical protein
MPPGEVQTFSASSSVFTTLWSDDRAIRRQKLGSLVMDLVRANKRILLLCPDHDECDELVGMVGRTMKAGGLNPRTWVTRYELPIVSQAAGLDLQELSFEAQMHQFYAKSQGDKATLKQKYDRFRALTPFLAQKDAKQKDLDEVRLLEWRLVTQFRELQVKMAGVETTLKEFETLPLFQRLALQAVGKNVDSLKQYQALYQSHMDRLDREIDVAKGRIQQLVPEAAVPRGQRAECEELKEQIAKLGGTKNFSRLRKIRIAKPLSRIDGWLPQHPCESQPTRCSAACGSMYLWSMRLRRLPCRRFWLRPDLSVNALLSAAIRETSAQLGNG